jgi:hypothetical protein
VAESSRVWLKVHSNFSECKESILDPYGCQDQYLIKETNKDASCSDGLTVFYGFLPERKRT